LTRVNPIPGVHKGAAYAVAMIVCAALFGGKCLAENGGGFEFWSTTGVSFDLDSKWKVCIDELLKVGHDPRQLSYQYTDLGFVYGGLADWLDLGLNYRQAHTKDCDGHWYRENRPHVNLTVKSRLGDIDLADRSRLEYRDRQLDPDIWRYANKLTIRLPHEFLKWKFQPYLADQVYINLTDSAFDGNKVYSGFTFKSSARTSGAFYYAWNSDKTDGKWTSTNILWLQLRIHF